MSEQFQEIDIDGHTFPVVAAREVETDEGMALYVLLRLTHEQLAGFRSMFRALPPSRQVHVRRIGLDAAPRVAMAGGYNYWSRHEEGEAVYYKQVLRLLPATTPIMPDAGLALSTDQESLTDMLVMLVERFETLVDELARTHAISSELHGKLIGDFTGPVMQDTERLDDIHWQPRRVGDAEELL